MSRLPTGVTVLTTLGGDGRHEVMTANAVTSVSLEPTLLLASVSVRSRWLAAVRQSGIFAVNILGAQHEALARWCADHARHERPEVVEAQATRIAPSTGLLLFAEALVAVECRVDAEHPAGDHVLVVGEVTALHAHDAAGPPLVFHNHGYSTVPTHGHLHSVDGHSGPSSVYPPDLEVPAAAASG